jgi:putative serine protease PepD
MRLEITTEDGSTSAVDVAGDIVVIGRDPACDVVLPDDAVSSRHAELRVAGGEVTLRDLGSRNGTHVSGAPITRPTRVGVGDRFRVGRTTVAVIRASGAGSTDQVFHTMVESRPRASAPRLRVESSDDTSAVGREVPIAVGGVIVGRGQGDVRLPGDTHVSTRHARVWLSGGSVWVEDIGSTNGTYVGGASVHGPRPLADGESLTVGHTLLRVVGAASADVHGSPTVAVPVAGTPAGLPGTAARSRWRSPWVAVAAVLVVLATGAGVAYAALHGESSAPTSAEHSSGGSSTPASGRRHHQRRSASISDLVRRLERSTVLIETQHVDGRSFIGSGTIIRKDGIILTNAHVGDPTAEGLGIQYDEAWTEAANRKIVVATIVTPDQPAQERYRAKLLASDGYLDVAVLQVTSTLDGTPVDPATLDLPAATMGDSNDLASGDHLNVLGYPGEGGGFDRIINYSNGRVSGFRPDSTLHTLRAWVKTDAPIAHGNSGGLAADDRGELIGMPTRVDTDTGGPGPVQGRIRAIDTVKPVIEAAESGTPYVSPYFVHTTGRERWKFRSFAAHEPTTSCSYRSTGNYPSGTPGVIPVYRASGMAPGEAFRVELFYQPTGGARPQPVGAVDGTWKRAWGPTSDCLLAPVRVQASELDDGTTVGDGAYSVQLEVGPNYTPFGDPEAVTIGGG